MKMRLLPVLIFMITTQVVNAQYGDIINGDFENWWSDTVAVEPQQWITSSTQEFAENIEISDDAQNGNSALYAETVVNLDDDTIGGYAILGSVDDGDFRGVPYSSDVNMFTGHFQYDIMAGDTGFVLVLLTNNGNAVGIAQQQFTGSQSGWLQVDIPILALSTPDSVWVGCASSNVITGEGVTPGSWIMMDNFSLSGPGNADPIPNGDFENWNYTIAEDPVNFATANFYSELFGSTSAAKTVDAQAGSFAIELTTTLVNDDTVQGVLTNGDVVDFGNDHGQPYGAMPTNFTGYYKYSMAGTDSAFVGVAFYAGGLELAVALLAIDADASAYTAFDIPISLSSQPDSMLVLATSGVNIGSALILDELHLTGGDVSVAEQAVQNHHLLYPNPASDRVEVIWNHAGGKGAFMLIDLEGRTVFHEAYGDLPGGLQKKAINLPELPAGVYLYRIDGAAEAISGKLVIE